MMAVEAGVIDKHTWISIVFPVPIRYAHSKAVRILDGFWNVNQWEALLVRS